MLYLDWYKKMRLRNKNKTIYYTLLLPKCKIHQLKPAVVIYEGWYFVVGKKIGEEWLLRRNVSPSRFCWDHCIWLHFPRDLFHLWGDSNISCNLWWSFTRPQKDKRKPSVKQARAVLLVCYVSHWGIRSKQERFRNTIQNVCLHFIF